MLKTDLIVRKHSIDQTQQTWNLTYMEKILPQDATKLPWTGERYVPEVSGPIELEHLHRYAIARDLAHGKTVLDIACGEGYGSAMLAEVAEYVTGVDIAEDVIAHARTKYQRSNLEFRAGACERIPLPDASVDLVVSFETIEHHDKHQEMMAEIRRVLRKDGVLIISSPDKYEHSDVIGLRNKFHVKELYLYEFEALLKTQFRYVAIFGQRIHYGSWIAPLSDKAQTSAFATFRGGPMSIQKTLGSYRPVYFVALASNAALPEISAGLFEGDREIAMRDRQIASLNQALAERDRLIVCLNQSLGERDSQISSLNQAIAERDERIVAMLQSTSWRITVPYRLLGHQIKRIRNVWNLLPLLLRQSGGIKATIVKTYRIYSTEGLRGIKRRLKGVQLAAINAQVRLSSGHLVSRNDYQEWVRRYDTIDDVMRSRMRAQIAELIDPPLISVIMPTYNANHQWLREAIASVQRQLYPHWELCIADDASTDPVIQPLLERYASQDPRIKLTFRKTNGHISETSNSALELATGQWIALLDHDDVLREDALYWVAQEIIANPEARMIYSDEDKIDENGVRYGPYFKDDWNPDLFLSQNMFSHLGVYQADLVRSVAGFRPGFEGAQDYDLALRCCEQIRPDQIVHIPRVLYHWRAHASSTASSVDAKPYAMAAGERALNEHFLRMGIKGQVKQVGFGYRARYELPSPPPLVSLLIPTRDHRTITEVALHSILEKTSYPNYEIILVANGSLRTEMLDWFEQIQREDQRIRIIRYDHPFNLSAINNFAVCQAKGSIIGLLSNDIEVISQEWLSEMVSHAVRKEIGCVGAKLYYKDGTIQHGGIVLGIGGVVGHSHKHFPKESVGYGGRLQLISNYSAVTAACLVVRKEVYEAVGGFDENLKVAFNDVDFCLKVREAGYRNLWTPYAELYHHESLSRDYEDTSEKQLRFKSEIQYMRDKWGSKFMKDPYYSPNLTLDFEDFSLAWPPRV